MTSPTPPSDDLAERVSAYVKAPTGAVALAFVTSCTNEATELVTVATTATWTEIPQEVLDRAIIEVAADLYHRQSTRLGVSGFADNDLNPVRITRDPMAAARPFLAPYLSGGIA